MPNGRRPQAGAAPGSFEHFFRAQYPVVVRIAYNVVRDVHLAEDVAQDVLIAAQRRFSEPYSSDHAAAVGEDRRVPHGAKRRAQSRTSGLTRNKQQLVDHLPVGPEDLAVNREEESRGAHGPVPPAAAFGHCPRPPA